MGGTGCAEDAGRDKAGGMAQGICRDIDAEDLYTSAVCRECVKNTAGVGAFAAAGINHSG